MSEERPRERAAAGHQARTPAEAAAWHRRQELAAREAGGVTQAEHHARQAAALERMARSGRWVRHR